MQLVQGKTLTELLPNNGFPLSKFFDIAIALTDGMSAAHEAGIVHRDLKPGNVMIASDARVKILDFGLAKTASGFAVDSEDSTAVKTEVGVIVGTAAYMSPEQAEGKAVDHRTDLFSLGTILFEMSTGQRPFRGDTPTALLSSILKDTPSSVSELKPGIPAELAELIQRCLAKDPEHRYQSAKDVRNELEAFRQDMESGHVTTGAPPPLSERRALRMSLWLASVGLMAVGAIIGFLAWSSDPTVESERIVVVPLENLTGDPTLDDIGLFVADGVTRGVSRSVIPDVVPATTVRERLLLGSPIQALAADLDASTIVSGNYVLVSESLRFQIEIIDAATGSLIEALEPVSVPLDSPTTAIGELGERVVVALGVRREIESGWRGLFSSSVSVESWREYTKGLELFNDTNFEEAWVSFERAFAQDPNYAAAVLYSANSLGNLGRLKEAEASLARLDPIRDLLTAGDRAYEDWLRNLYFRGDLRAEYRAAEELLRLNANGVAGFVAGFSAQRNDRPAEAVEHLSRFADSEITDRWAQYWDTFGHAYHDLHDYEKELDVVRQGHERMNRPGLSFHGDVDALAALGLIDELDGVLELEPSALLCAAQELRAHGYPEHAGVCLDRALDWYRTRPPREDVRYELAQTLYEKERWDEAGLLFNELAAEKSDNLDLLGWLGVTFARRGERAAAMRVDQQLNQWKEPYLLGGHMLWRARIAAVVGDQDGAVSLLERSNREGTPRSSGWASVHTIKDFESLRGHRSFQELVRPKG